MSDDKDMGEQARALLEAARPALRWSISDEQKRRILVTARARIVADLQAPTAEAGDAAVSGAAPSASGTVLTLKLLLGTFVLSLLGIGAWLVMREDRISSPDEQVPIPDRATSRAPGRQEAARGLTRADDVLTLRSSAESARPECALPPPGAQHPLWEQYRTQPFTHSRVPDISSVGYRFGERPLPDVVEPVFDVRAARFGAAGDGKADDTEAIRRALDAAAREGGVVLFPAGEYLISGVLSVHSSRTVLRGEGAERTKLLFTRPLESAYGPNIRRSYSRWSWTGGLLWFGPRRTSPATDSSRDAGWELDDWSMGERVVDVTAAARRGDRRLQVNRTDRLRPGALVFLEVEETAERLVEPRGKWLGAVAQSTSETTAQGLMMSWSHGRVWPLEIAAVDVTGVTLKQPLRIDVSLAAKPRLRAAGEILQDVGVENMTIVMRRQDAWSALGLTAPGWNGPFFNSVVHGFLRNVTVLDADLGFVATASKNLTVTGLRMQRLALDARTYTSYGLVARNDCHDILFEDFDIDPSYWSGINVEPMATGIVFSRGRARFQRSRGILFDAVVTEVRLPGGRPSDSSWFGATTGTRLVTWNVQPDPSTTPITMSPINLYEAQRRLQLCASP